MQKIAKFEKVSKEVFLRDWKETFSDSDSEVTASEIYEKIKLPKRATVGSAGYDFFTPRSVTLAPRETIKIPTGIRCRMQNGWALLLFPRSGLGFKYRMQLDNTVGVVDSDYYHSDNEGHIFAKITNDSKNEKTIFLEAGSAFAQGIFLPFGITEDDDTDGIRNGGMGSTDKEA